jgi:RimJ/RimL family protein N-acetyltransferase
MGTMQPLSYSVKTGQSIVVRSAVPLDAQALIDLSRSLLEEREAIVTTFEESLMSEAQEVAWLQSYATDSQKIVLVAEVAGSIVGMLDFQNGARKRLAHQSEFGMSVLKEWRGIGVGKALLQALIDWCAENSDIVQIRLAVFSNNEPAIHLYDSLGFVQEGRLMNQAHMKDGSFCDLLLMVKSIKKTLARSY